MHETMLTYTNGFCIKYMRDVSRKQFIEICSQLGCTPEPIQRGGLLFSNDDVNGFKTMRLYISDYPWINSTVMNDWKEDTTILIEKGTETSTFLKAFGAAQPWTLEELYTVQDVLEQYGCRITKMPAAKTLIYNPDCPNSPHILISPRTL